MKTGEFLAQRMSKAVASTCSAHFLCDAIKSMIELTTEKLSLDALINAVAHAGAGAIATFTGTVRDYGVRETGESSATSYLEYSCYETMARRELEKIAAQAQEQWPIRCAISHRLGHLKIGEASVMIAVAGAHRGETFEACRWIIDTLKKRVPIWKKEVAPDGEWWVEAPSEITE